MKENLGKGLILFTLLTKQYKQIISLSLFASYSFLSVLD